MILTFVKGAEKTKEIKSGIERHIRQSFVHARSADCGPKDKPGNMV